MAGVTLAVAGEVVVVAEAETLVVVAEEVAVAVAEDPWCPKPPVLLFQSLASPTLRVLASA